MVSKQVSKEVLVNLPLADVWEKLCDLSMAHNYVPGLVNSEIVTEKKAGVGASRLVYQSTTKHLQETVVEWNEGAGFIIRLHRGEKGPPFPFKEAFFRYQIQSGADTDTTRITTTMSYTMALGILGAILEKFLLRKAFNSMIRDIAISLKAFYESGERVTPEKLKQLKLAYKNASTE